MDSNLEPSQVKKTDEELAKLSIVDSSSFSVIIDRYERKLRRYINRLGKFSCEDVEDLLQEIFIKVYQNLNAFDDDLKFSSWIYRIAHNQTISFVRSHKSRPQGNSVELEDEEMQNIADDLDIISDAEQKDLNKKIVKIIEELDPKYRDILLLKFFEYKSYEEISDILEIPQGTVSVRISRAKEKLKAILEKENYLN